MPRNELKSNNTLGQVCCKNNCVDNNGGGFANHTLLPSGDILSYDTIFFRVIGCALSTFTPNKDEEQIEKDITSKSKMDDKRQSYQEELLVCNFS